MQKSRKVQRPTQPRLNQSLRTCLGVVLDYELRGKPLSVEQYRARNPRQVPHLDQLASQRLIKRDQQYVVTFWGLLAVRSKVANTVLKNCETVYKILGRHYSEVQYVPLSLNELQNRTGLTSEQIVRCVLFLERSPWSPAIGPDWQNSGVVATEYYVTHSFKQLKQCTAEVNTNAQMPVGATFKLTERFGLISELGMSESEAVRDSWSKALATVSSDPAGAITAARSLVEAACRHVLAEFAISNDEHGNLPRLYKDASARLGLSSNDETNNALRRLLAGCTAVVDGLAEFRNLLGDSHGKGPLSQRPARRHAALAVALGGGMSAFLLATLDAMRRP
jgi:hypothetical protein